jgi:hypothetical protein
MRLSRYEFMIMIKTRRIIIAVDAWRLYMGSRFLAWYTM